MSTDGISKMKLQKFLVSATAELQVAELSPRDRLALESLMTDEPAQSDATRTPKGHFMSRLSSGKRVLWDKPANGQPKILSIVDPSYTN
jgi:hypothetical protein